MIHWTELDIEFDAAGNPIRGEICFSHVDDKDGTVRHFAIDRINRELERMAALPQIIEFPIDPVFAAFAMQHRGVEMHRWNRITPMDVAAYPILLAKMPGVGRDTPDSHLIIDGIHRYTRAASWGWQTMRGYELPEEFWSRFLIELPEDFYDKERLTNQHVNPIDSHIP